MRSPNPRSNRASALIVALAVLLIMFLLASVLAMLSTSARRTSAAYVDQVRARMLARSGIEHARSRAQDLSGEEAQYEGEDWNGDRELSGVAGTVINAEDAAGESEDANGNRNGRFDREGLPPRYALNPSFAATRNGHPALVRIKRGDQFVYRGFTGTVPQSYGGQGADTYSVRVDPLEGINVNSLNPNVGEMINHLCTALEDCQGDTNPGYQVVGPFPSVEVRREDVDEDDHDERVIATLEGDRPDVTYDPQTERISGGYGNVDDLRGQLGGNFEVLEPYLVTHRHVRIDTSVIRPLPQNTEMTFDEDGDCPEEAGPYADCRVEEGEDLRDAHPLPDGVAGRPKAIRGPVTTDNNHPEAQMAHTETVHWMNGIDIEDDVVEGGENYGSFRYNFDFKKQPRAPVGINTTSEPLMKALLQGLRARVMEITERDVASTRSAGEEPQKPYIEDRWLNPMYRTRVIPSPEGSNSGGEGEGLSEELAERIFEEIDEYRKGESQIQFRGVSDYTGPFKTWPEFEAFVEQQLVEDRDGSMGGGISNDVGYLLKAHFNPNTHFGKFNWDTNGMWTWISDGEDRPDSKGNRVMIDKTDFLYHTTEFTMLPATHYELASHGRVIGADGEVKAMASVKSILQTSEVARHTTQADFEVNQDRSETANVNTYPENVANVVFGQSGDANSADAGPMSKGEQEGEAIHKQIENRPNTGSNLAGQLAVDTVRDGLPPSIGSQDTYMRLSFDQPDRSTRGRPDPRENWKGFRWNERNDVLLPYSWFSREYNDVSDDATKENAGLVGGAWTPDEHFDRGKYDGNGLEYPWNDDAHRYLSTELSREGNRIVKQRRAPQELDTSEDPYNYSDITPDGVLITSDRYRSIRYINMVEDEGRDENIIVPRKKSPGRWTHDMKGHVEFWWKPRAATLSTHDDDPLSDTKTIYPLWSQWRLAEHQEFYEIGYVGDHSYTDEEASGDQKETGLHSLTQQPNYGWRMDDRPDRSASPPWPHVTVSQPDGQVRWWNGEGDEDQGMFHQNGKPMPADRHGEYTADMNGVATVAKEPVDESQPHAGYDCSWNGPFANRYRYGQGTIARITPDSGCLHAYPGIQFRILGTDRDHAGIGGRIHPETEALTDDPSARSLYTFRDVADRGGRVSRAARNHVVNAGDTTNDYPAGLNLFSNPGHMGSSMGYYFRAYYVREPASSNRASKWVFKISREYFMDMDAGLGAPQSPGPRTDLVSESSMNFGWSNYQSSGETSWLLQPQVSDMVGDVVARLNVEKKPRAEPIPGKWTHVVLEFDWDDIYDFRAGEVGGGPDHVSYPVYVPHDFYHTDEVSYDNRSLDESEISDDRRPDWLPIAVIPRDEDTEIPHVFSDISGTDPDDGRGNARWPVPYINVNGVRKTRTDLHVGNVNPITGKFQPPALLFAEHAVWDGGDGPASEKVTSWHYMRHYTHKHFGNMGRIGSNFSRRTKRYGRVPEDGSTWRYNWARFYDDGFVNGTIDEFYWVNDASKASVEPYHDDRYVHPADRTVQYTGTFQRQSEDRRERRSREKHDESGRVASKDRSITNGFRDDREVLQVDDGTTARITRVAHTQYRPHDSFRGRDYNASGHRVVSDNLPESARPYFDVTFRTGSDTWRTKRQERTPVAPRNRWLGEPVRPRELFGREMYVSDGDSLAYRVRVQNPTTPMNVTPFLEDVTVMYARVRLKSFLFYTP